ncbi:hypothetical protein KIPB_009842, partial [Kipferlia bialata]|eukprot:g9842.t1
MSDQRTPTRRPRNILNGVFPTTVLSTPRPMGAPDTFVNTAAEPAQPASPSIQPTGHSFTDDTVLATLVGLSPPTAEYRPSMRSVSRPPSEFQPSRTPSPRSPSRPGQGFPDTVPSSPAAGARTATTPSSTFRSTGTLLPPPLSPSTVKRVGNRERKRELVYLQGPATSMRGGASTSTIIGSTMGHGEQKAKEEPGYVPSASQASTMPPVKPVTAPRSSGPRVGKDTEGETLSRGSSGTMSKTELESKYEAFRSNTAESIRGRMAVSIQEYLPSGMVP